MYYCMHCGHELDQIGVGISPAICPRCQKRVTFSPRLAVCGLLTKDSSVLLVKRCYDPSAGLWCLPGGLLEPGEQVENALIREVLEEVNIDICMFPRELSGVYADIDLDTVTVVYTISITAISVSAGEEVVDVKFFPTKDIPWNSLAFQSTRSALENFIIQCNPSSGQADLDTAYSDGNKIITNPGTICVDLDGVIVDISGGYFGPQHFGSLLPGAKEALDTLHCKGWVIVINTSRDDIDATEKFLNSKHLKYDFVNRHTLSNPVSINPLADIYIDDKALTFDGNWEKTLEKIMGFQVWYKK